jgi:thymidine phosphorylase
MTYPEMIRTKRDGLSLSPADWRTFVRGITSGDASDAQVAAMAMACYYQDLNAEERIAVTLAMRDSGQVLDWSAVSCDGPIFDKHSTGGVGDLVSIALGPLLAACGGYVPMIAGRGLAHTGGTVDKLESIPGYNPHPDPADFQRIVQRVGVAIAGQTAALAPADRRLYALRDVTATVEQVGLITASILSKKLAAGLEHLVMDIKVGRGAFMQTVEQGRELAQAICDVGSGSGMPTAALLTRMDDPLARSAGNAVEIEEAVALLRGEVRSEPLKQVTWALASELLVNSGLASDLSEASRQLDSAWHAGTAYERYAQSVAAMGGDPDAALPTAPIRKAIPLVRPGVVVDIDSRAVGLAVVALGGGRTRPGALIDSAVGLTELAFTGEAPAHQLGVVHARNEADAEAAIWAIQQAYTMGEEAPDATEPILERVISTNHG